MDMRGRVRVALAAVGFTSTVGQIVLMRELVAAFYGNELVFGLILAAWMAWVAVGSWGLGGLLRRRGWGAGAFAGAAALTAVLLPLQIALTRSVRTWLGVTPGAFVEFGQMVWAILLIPAPLCILLGAQFTLGAALLAGDAAEGGRSTGAAYAIESVGAVLGGALFSFVLVFVLDPFQIALGLAALNLAVAAVVGCRAAGRALRIGVAGMAALALVLAWSLGGRLHRDTLARQWPDMTFTVDSRYGRLVVVQRGEQRVFFENGLLMFETQGTFAEEVAHLPLLAHPNPSRVLLLGGGVGGVLRETLKHPVEEVYYVELDPRVIEVAAQALPPDEAALLDDPRVHLVYGDGRRFVDADGGDFDVVIVNLPEPATGQINRFYTREFFEGVRAILAPGGILSLGLPSAENYWSPELARRNASVFQTARDVFPQVVVTPGDHNFYLASAIPLSDQAAPLVERLSRRGIETRQVQAPYLEWLFTTDRFAQARALLEAETGVRHNRDLAPICYYYDMALWLALFGSGLRSIFEAATLVRLWWLLPPLLAGAVALRRSPRPAMSFAVGLVGLAAMSLENVLLFAFQALYGYVYYAVGLVVTAYMGGLALGAGLAGRVGEAQARRTLFGVLAGMALYAALLPLLFTARLPVAHLSFALLALGAGVLGGLAFALVARLFAGLPGVETGTVAGALYGADLVGGCVGAVLTGVFLVPVFGIPQTCWAVAVVVLAGLILCTSTRSRS
jgi:spermidine synthase